MAAADLLPPHSPHAARCRVDFRLVAATNRELEKEVTRGRFRPDLYYRLKVVTIALPALRERPEDVAALVSRFIGQFNQRLGRNVARVAPALLQELRRQPWPGNVRELRNVVESMVLFSRGEELTLGDLPDDFRRGGAIAGPATASSEWRPRPMAELEREAILRTLEFTSGHRAKAAQLLDIGLRTLQRKLKEYGAGGPDDEGDGE